MTPTVKELMGRGMSGNPMTAQCVNATAAHQNVWLRFVDTQTVHSQSASKGSAVQPAQWQAMEQRMVEKVCYTICLEAE